MYSSYLGYPTLFGRKQPLQLKITMYSKICLQLILLSQGKFFLMNGSLEVMYDLIINILCVIQISFISLIN